MCRAYDFVRAVVIYFGETNPTVKITRSLSNSCADAYDFVRVLEKGGAANECGCI